MDNLFFQQDTVDINSIPCRRISIEKRKAPANETRPPTPNGTIYIKSDELDTEDCLSYVRSSQTNFAVVYHTDQIIDEILESYTTTSYGTSHLDKIFKQMALDFPRMEILFNSESVERGEHLSLGSIIPTGSPRDPVWNSELCTTIDMFQNKIIGFCRYSHPKLGTVYNLLVMLCTQASFFYPFNILNKIYTLDDLGIHVMASDDPGCISIVDNKISIDIIFKKLFKYMNTSTETVITKFWTCMVITIYLVEETDGYIFYGKKYCSYDNAIVYCVKEKNLIIV